MKRLLSCAALVALLAPVPAMAQQWYRVATNDLGTQYVDLASIVPDGDYLRAAEIAVYVEPRESGAKYIATVAQYDCRGRRAHFVRFEPFTSANVSLGVLNDPDQGEFVESAPDSPGQRSLDFICNVDRGGAVLVEDPRTDTP